MSQGSQLSQNTQATLAYSKWGALTYTRDGVEERLELTKDGSEGESGIGGYIFGRRSDCDHVLGNLPVYSGRHFLIYKETMSQAESGRPTVAVYIKDLSLNGTFVNRVLVGTNKRIQLKDGDKIQFEQMRPDSRKSKHNRSGKSQKDEVITESEFTFIASKFDKGKKFDQVYELGPQLGEGNFASVFAAVEVSTQTTKAVKRVNKMRGFGSKIEESLEREIGILNQIDHPNLLRVFDTFSEPQYYYVVTELARDGELFDQIIDKQKFTESEARNIFQQVLGGVKYLHDNGIVHRDLKPENILVMDKVSMTVKISDFGLAKIVGEGRFRNTVCGTPSYVAPEILAKLDYGKGVDMWSLGVILYICLCGFPPFSDDLAPPDLKTQVMQSMYTFPSPYWDEVSDEAVDLIQGLLTQDPNQRMTVDDALDHIWMSMEDEEKVAPQKPRTAPMPQITRMFSRVLTMRSDRYKQRHQQLSQKEQWLSSQPEPEGYHDEFDNSQPHRSCGNPFDTADLEEEEDQEDRLLVRNSSGIGIFSQEGMIRTSGGTGLEGETDDEHEGNTSERTSFMSVSGEYMSASPSISAGPSTAVHSRQSSQAVEPLSKASTENHRRAAPEPTNSDDEDRTIKRAKKGK